MTNPRQREGPGSPPQAFAVESTAGNAMSHPKGINAVNNAHRPAGAPVIRISPRHGDLSAGHQDMRLHGGMLSQSRPAGPREVRRTLARVTRKGGVRW